MFRSESFFASVVALWDIGSGLLLLCVGCFCSLGFVFATGEHNKNCVKILK